MPNYTRILKVGLLSITSFLLLKPAITLAESVSTLRAGNFRVTITDNCPEGYVTCEDVDYYGVNLDTGDSIHLSGRTVHTICADGVTPCRFVGYVFFNGNYRYFVGTEGTLEVYEGEERILNLIGTWEH